MYRVCLGEHEASHVHMRPNRAKRRAEQARFAPQFLRIHIAQHFHYVEQPIGIFCKRGAVIGISSDVLSQNAGEAGRGTKPRFLASTTMEKPER